MGADNTFGEANLNPQPPIPVLECPWLSGWNKHPTECPNKPNCKVQDAEKYPGKGWLCDIEESLA